MELKKDLIELENISQIMDFSKNTFKKSLVKGSHKYYHYLCDGFNDVGWGCGYRTLQTMCSWIREQINTNNKIHFIEKEVRSVPSILEIQKILHECGDKPARFVGSKDWIGCFEACIVIDCLYDVPCKIVHCNTGELSTHTNEVVKHFENFASPIMLGGDLDNASKGILGITLNNEDDIFLLIADPHFYSNQTVTKDYLIQNEWLKWRSLGEFQNFDSFYNFCLPQLKSN